MTRFEKMRADCRKCGVIKDDEMIRKDVCGVNRDRECAAESCPSLEYWSGDRTVGCHYSLMTEKQEEAYAREMA